MSQDDAISSNVRQKIDQLSVPWEYFHQLKSRRLGAWRRPLCLPASSWRRAAAATLAGPSILQYWTAPCAEYLMRKIVTKWHMVGHHQCTRKSIIINTLTMGKTDCTWSLRISKRDVNFPFNSSRFSFACGACAVRYGMWLRIVQLHRARAPSFNSGPSVPSTLTARSQVNNSCWLGPHVTTTTKNNKRKENHNNNYHSICILDRPICILNQAIRMRPPNKRPCSANKRAHLHTKSKGNAV